MKAISLFSSIGVAEYYLKDLGIDIILSSELIEKRACAHKELYPEADIVVGDISDENTQNEIIKKVNNEKIDIIIATPPCQGISWAGLNKTAESIKKDKRNYLVLSALDIFEKVEPNYFIIENVPRFSEMVFPSVEKFLTLEELLIEKYSSNYNVKVDIFDASDYGVPQTRKRIVYRIWRKGKDWPDPEKKEKITLEKAIGELPSLEAGESSSIKNHVARKHPQNQIECMKHTPTGESAFSNEFFYPKKADGNKIKGFKNTYKRMKWDQPAPTITMRNEIVSSQENVHPGKKISDYEWSDARVLTLRELLIVSSLPPDLDKPVVLSDTSFRQLIGEGIPPKMMLEIMKGITI